MTPAAPPASGPQEAATPLHALADAMEDERDRLRAEAASIPGHSLASGQIAIAGAWDRAAPRIRELALEWDALAAERDRLREELARWQRTAERLEDVRERYDAALRAIDELPMTVEQARETARDALEGNHD